MGKHKNRAQSEIYIDFMEINQDIAKGFSKRDKALVDSLWDELTESLNSAGPPNKDKNGWKKTWTDWKAEVKKKLAKNMMEERATGGGPFAKHVLSQTEEAIVRICGMARSVEGVSGVAMGLVEDETINNEVDLPTTSNRMRSCDSAEVVNTPKKRKRESSSDRLKAFLEKDNEYKKEMSGKMDELIKIHNDNASSLRRVYRAIEKGNDSVANSITDLKNDFLNFGANILKMMDGTMHTNSPQIDYLSEFEDEKENRFNM